MNTQIELGTPIQIACNHIYKPTNTPCGAKPGEPCRWQGFEKGLNKMFHDKRVQDAAVSFVAASDVAA